MALPKTLVTKINPRQAGPNISGFAMLTIHSVDLFDYVGGEISYKGNSRTRQVAKIINTIVNT